MPQTPTENPIAKHPITLGDFRRVTAGLPDSTPIVNDVVEGPDEWTTGIVSIESGLPQAWHNVQDAEPGIYIHMCIFEMEDGGPDEPQEDLPSLSNAQINFFHAEIENERHGGDSPSTLNSALDSLHQADVETIIEWCADTTIVHDNASVTEFIGSITNLESQCGGDTPLQALIDANPGHEGKLDPGRIAQDQAEFCDECGAKYPDDATGLFGKFHAETCSLHPDNIVG